MKTVLGCHRPTSASAVVRTSYLAVLAALLSLSTYSVPVIAAGEKLNTTLPSDGMTGRVMNVDIPSQALAASLQQFANYAGVSLSFDSKITTGKIAPAVKGYMTGSEILNQLLTGTDLESVSRGDSIIIKRKDKTQLELKETKVRAKRFYDVGPMPGLNLTKEQIAGNIQSITAKEIKEAHALSLSDLMNSKLQSVNVNDYQGNPFQMDVSYRGFTAGPQIGTPQGLSVFFDGVRVNEPFGDVVNWDMIPLNALGGMDVFPGSNPLFGLNTLGGALVMRTKSGFTDEGVSAEVLAGSYGRKQLQVSGGINNADKEEGSWDLGDFAAFGAGNFFLEDGWRDNSPSEVNQAYGKLEWQGDRASLALSGLGVINKLKGNGTVPQELYRQDASAVFTSPDETQNKLFQLKLAGIFDVTNTFNITSHAYYRNSKRHSTTGDIIDLENFQPDGTYSHEGTRLPGTGKNIHCAYADDNRDGIPNYFVVSEANYMPFLISAGTGGGFDMSLTQNEGSVVVPEPVINALQTIFATGVYDVFVNPYIQGTDDLPYGAGTISSFMDFPQSSSGMPYLDADGTTSYIFAHVPVNADVCRTGINGYWNQGMIAAEGGGVSRDGALGAEPYTGVIEGTPTAITTDSNIQQVSKGLALQLNWNTDYHKFMVGTSIDKATSSYVGKQRLGTLDENRNVINDPNLLGEEYYFADHDATINDFAGKSSTRSAYFSETWTPTQTLNFSFSARYNYTNIINKLAPTKADRTLTGLRYLNRYAYGIICPGTDLSECPYSLDAPIPAETYFNELVMAGLFPSGLNLLEKSATEKFSYHSLNPSIGATWQAKPNLNLYANWNQGTRAPSVIELGCAYDATLVIPTDIYGNPTSTTAIPRSLAEGRGCKLPSSLSGDPYLPQVVAQTYEVGARGKFNDFLEWNVSAYRTNVRDDIYLTALTGDLSFFQSIGDTRRQGIEFGMAGEYGKSDFRMNYSLTDATFQSHFKTFSTANSTAVRDPFFGPINVIDVKPGNVMPGVPFNNFNFNWGYKLTPNLKLNMNMVAHSRSYLRGNENNAHTPNLPRVTADGIGRGTGGVIGNNYSGTAPGYAVLNMSGRYNFGNGWAASLMVNNVLDKKYYSAGRLGVSPFAPSTYGAIGSSGFNYNSNEWISSQFISAGAPRGVWASLSYDFDATQKGELPSSNITRIEPDTLEAAYVARPSSEEVALLKQIDELQSQPVTQRTPYGVEMAKHQVKLAVEAWNMAMLNNNADAYIQSYSAGYAPPGTSHNGWADEQKTLIGTEQVQSSALSDIVVAPMGKKLAAVFTQTALRAGQPVVMRKVLTFEQKEGQWKIVRERNTSPSYLDVKSTKPINTSMNKKTRQSDRTDKGKQVATRNLQVSGLESAGVQ
ncbi:TonB-dependent receptor domain-containing protein [Methylotenera sp. N17]|uniref:TonB-dependent receptor domain-containing protein n=1 Tax=Methylotenera sp. N17 TaxID=1502761 RepID=UPI000AB1D6A1|nr:TonB-dependent receptor [Methylotenera sp. N17]